MSTSRPNAGIVDALIQEALDSVADLRDAEDPLVCTPATKLFGRDGVLTSLEFVSFIVELETLLTERLGANIVLADERALSRSNSPFRSAGELGAYISSLLET